jgi:hypothetical protein
MAVKSAAALAQQFHDSRLLVRRWIAARSGAGTAEARELSPRQLRRLRPAELVAEVLRPASSDLIDLGIAGAIDHNDTGEGATEGKADEPPL